MKQKTLTYVEALAIAKEFDDSLLATHPGFDGAVLIIDEEGTILFYNYAFVKNIGLCAINEKKCCRWWGVFTEHHKFYVFSEADAKIYSFQSVENNWWEKSEHQTQQV